MLTLVIYLHMVLCNPNEVRIMGWDLIVDTPSQTRWVDERLRIENSIWKG